MNNFLIFYIIAVTLIILILFFGTNIHYKEQKKAFSLLSNLPNEFLISNNKKITILRCFFITPLVSLFISVLTLLFLNINQIYKGQLILFVALIFIGVLSFSILYFLSTNYFNIYLVFFVLLIVSSLMSYAVVAYLGFISLQDISLIEVDIKKIIVACISVLIFLFNLFTISKTLTNSIFQMDKKINDDGTSEVVRPKLFPLAYMQWLSLCSLFLSSILVFLLFV